MQPNLRPFFQTQLKLERIQSVNQTTALQRIQQEQQQLKKLQTNIPSYLNQYDQLFRWMSLALLQHGFDLTQHQPHQVLKAWLTQFFPQHAIDTLISHRHQLKKKISQQVDSEIQLILCQVLEHMPRILQAYEMPIQA